MEGIYSHIYNASSKSDTNKQYEVFENITSDIDLKDIPIVHIGAITDGIIVISNISILLFDKGLLKERTFDNTRLVRA